MMIEKDIFIVMALTSFDRKVAQEAVITVDLQGHLAKPVK
jgi:hypothetical protein